jgi:SET and MYND domain-containing protein
LNFDPVFGSSDASSVAALDFYFFLSPLQMSDFSQLKEQRKAQRKAHKARSFVPSGVPVHGKPEMQETGGLNEMEVVDFEVTSQETSSSDPIPLDIQGRYTAIPPTLDVRVTGRNGRGVYSKFNRRPGE